MTAVFPVPIIPRHRYAAFRHDVGSDLADTYDEWLKVVHKIRGDEFGPGETLVEVPVDREPVSYTHLDVYKRQVRVGDVEWVDRNRIARIGINDDETILNSTKFSNRIDEVALAVDKDQARVGFTDILHDHRVQ